MSEKYKIVEEGIPYFVTFTVVKWLDVFTRNEYRDIIIDSLNFCQKNKGLNVYAFCIMTNHIHLIISSSKNSKLSNIIRDFRGFTSKQLKQMIMESPLESRKDWMLSVFLF